VKSLVKGLFGSGKKAGSERRLEHPRELAIGDMIRMSDSFALPLQIRDKLFRLVSVNTYQFERAFDTSFSLESDSDDRIDIMVEKEDGRERLCISMTIDRDDVESIFDIDAFVGIFDSDDPVSLTPRSEEGFEGWLGLEYAQQAKGTTGFYHEGSDYRGTKPSRYEDDSEPFEYYGLVSDDERFGIDIEVWEDGETDVALSIYRPLEDAKELWPGANQGS